MGFSNYRGTDFINNMCLQKGRKGGFKQFSQTLELRNLASAKSLILARIWSPLVCVQYTSICVDFCVLVQKCLPVCGACDVRGFWVHQECVTQIHCSSGPFGNLVFAMNRHINKVCLPVRSSVGQKPRTQARQVYSSNTNSFSLQGVQVQQQLTSPLRITWRHTHTPVWKRRKGLKAPMALWCNLILHSDCPVVQGKRGSLCQGIKSRRKKRKMYRINWSLLF